MGMREMREEFGSAIRAGEKGGKSTWVARSLQRDQLRPNCNRSLKWLTLSPQS